MSDVLVSVVNNVFHVCSKAAVILSCTGHIKKSACGAGCKQSVAMSKNNCFTICGESVDDVSESQGTFFRFHHVLKDAL